MWGAPSGNVYLAPGVTDMRRSINSLALMVVETLGMEPVGPHWFVFGARQRNKLGKEMLKPKAAEAGL